MAQRITPTAEQRDLVLQLASIATTHDDISMIVGVSKASLHKHYKHELSVGLAKANATIRGELFKQAKSGNMTAICFWLKCKDGWREVNRQEITGKDGEPIDIKPSVLRGMTTNEIVEALSKRNLPVPPFEK